MEVRETQSYTAVVQYTDQAPMDGVAYMSTASLWPLHWRQTYGYSHHRRMDGRMSLLILCVHRTQSVSAECF